MRGLDVKNFDDLKDVFKLMAGETLENGLDGELDDKLSCMKYDCRNREGALDMPMLLCYITAKG